MEECCNYEIHGTGAMVGTKVTERVQSIGAQCKPRISWIFSEAITAIHGHQPIDVPPLWRVGRVTKHVVLNALICVPMHQFCHIQV
jgi:hypothetical protein